MSLLKSLFGGGGPSQVAVQPSGETFAVAKGETVLESALKQGLAYPHDCTVGTCGTCRTKLISGKVDAITPFSYTLSKEELAAGYIVACQALAKSDLVVEVALSSGGAIETLRQLAKLIASENLTHDIKRVRWQVETPMRYKAGQYMNVHWEGSDEHRTYSFALPPGADGLTTLETFIRHVPGGRFTDMLFSGDPTAQNFEIDGPHGSFWLRDGKGPILCIAGGSGLAPILSLLQDAVNRKVRRDCILLFGARTQRDLYATEEIAAIRRAWLGNFDYWPVLSEEAAEGTRSGMVTIHVAAALARLGPGAQAYMCGPPPMIDAGISVVSQLGVGIDDIHYDKFTDMSSKA